jgi:predicted metal-dependent phosphoesterase TrpH
MAFVTTALCGSKARRKSGGGQNITRTQVAAINVARGQLQTHYVACVHVYARHSLGKQIAGPDRVIHVQAEVGGVCIDAHPSRLDFEQNLALFAEKVALAQVSSHPVNVPL